MHGAGSYPEWKVAVRRSEAENGRCDERFPAGAMEAGTAAPRGALDDRHKSCPKWTVELGSWPTRLAWISMSLRCYARRLTVLEHFSGGCGVEGGCPHPPSAGTIGGRGRPPSRTPLHHPEKCSTAEPSQLRSLRTVSLLCESEPGDCMKHDSARLSRGGSECKKAAKLVREDRLECRMGQTSRAVRCSC